MFFIGITIGRALNGFLAMKLSDTQMVRMGQVLIACGVVILFLPLGASVSLAGFVMIGLGCAPIYPCLIHSTPDHFGADKSQAIIGIQMACAYVGSSLMPPLFGLIAGHITVSLLPVYSGTHDCHARRADPQNCTERSRLTADYAKAVCKPKPLAGCFL